MICLLYTSDAADEEDSVDLGGRRIIKKKNRTKKKKKEKKRGHTTRSTDYEKELGRCTTVRTMRRKDTYKHEII